MYKAIQKKKEKYKEQFTNLISKIDLVGLLRKRIQIKKLSIKILFFFVR